MLIIPLTSQAAADAAHEAASDAKQRALSSAQSGFDRGKAGASAGEQGREAALHVLARAGFATSTEDANEIRQRNAKCD